jgi:ribosomal protein S18 acetylase RimI-like enzyme
MDIHRYAEADLPGILRLCAAEGWPSFTDDPARAHRALTAPGVTTMVAADGDEIAGFVQMQGDGEIQAHLSLIAVDAAFRGRGAGRALIERAFELAGGLRVDLVTDSAEGFYDQLPRFRMSGFRLYPTYTGPDRDRPGVVWENGRRLAR